MLLFNKHLSNFIITLLLLLFYTVLIFANLDPVMHLQSDDNFSEQSTISIREEQIHEYVIINHSSI